ncbi:dihydroorotase [Pseudoalteromonas phenolica]|uniref:Dihydroorotase n=1 Tax=Pseudoalteromonas phenolica TaxID=161398 RepID=A0A5R9Q6P5_9GAMM|nr:dihydroorotase [Pseudoalteromonas phenolica]TLX48818.1 dihydroorotase [Pseudoalteromonas phenolica]
MAITIITNAVIINEGKTFNGSVAIEQDRFIYIGKTMPEYTDALIIDAKGKYLIPGVIDGQVHFRDPGVTHKADMESESKAAVAGGVTSYIDMPNSRPNVLNHEVWQAKNALAATKSLANYDFYMGLNNDNVDVLLDTDTTGYSCLSDDGLYFAGPGNLLADSEETLDKIFSKSKNIIAIHAEIEGIIHKNEQKFKAEYGEDVPVKFHPIIRSEEACVKATERAIRLATKHNARLHVLHLTTAKEAAMFRNDIPLEEKRITTEASVHHLWFNDSDYEEKGTLIKWNPAIKTEQDRLGLIAAINDDRIDIITTDHAPHTLEEKQNTYFKAMSGGPFVQHSLVVMIELHLQGYLTLEKIVEKMCHNPALLYGFKDRGYIRPGYKADFTLVDMDSPWTVSKDNILYKCGWSPVEGQTFKAQVKQTYVNGHKVFDNGEFDTSKKGEQLELLPWEERIYVKSA